MVAFAVFLQCMLDRAGDIVCPDRLVGGGEERVQDLPLPEIGIAGRKENRRSRVIHGSEWSKTIEGRKIVESSFELATACSATHFARKKRVRWTAEAFRALKKTKAIDPGPFGCLEQPDRRPGRSSSSTGWGGWSPDQAAR